MEITRRYRVNVGTSVKGVKSYDCTVEITGSPLAVIPESDLDPEKEATFPAESIREKILAESDALVAELDKRYPPPKE